MEQEKNVTSQPGQLLTVGALSKRWGVAMSTIYYWIQEGRGPSYMKIGNAIRYRIEDVEAYEKANYHELGAAS
ncbi:helix-turn-helix transcriptional regulator [Qingshengfaniella alkalisoli]|uniref:Helix-turn-helix domain-containing protein n=1 Tax=Qingshengfaniella alkalisoli TaxID=2599296 RepID=A0A5B8IWQ0_9RHOB|nr:helix-turn-helix domain-containing protein [Qingshengfaniella alkalisoli]QDY70114.1 helix-turn-helix domain-containing protein [Qingshengfaniella alkalisoli]